MDRSAWIFMTLVWAVIIGATVYSFWKLLTSKRQFHEEDDMLPPHH